MRYITCLVLIFYSTLSYSSQTCSLKGTKLLFTNGILTSRELAEASLERILNLKFQKLKIMDQIDSGFPLLKHD